MKHGGKMASKKLNFTPKTSLYFNKFLIHLHFILHQPSIAPQQSPPITLDVFHSQIFQNHFLTSLSNFFRQIFVFNKKFQQFFQIFGFSVAFDGNVVDPGLEGTVEKLLPFVANVKDQ